MRASNRWACLTSFWPTFHHFAEKLPGCAQHVGVQKALFHTASLWPFAGLSGGGFIHILARREPRPESAKSHSWKVAESALGAGLSLMKAKRGQTETTGAQAGEPGRRRGHSRGALCVPNQEKPNKKETLRKEEES